jgi:hypothetical protein
MRKRLLMVCALCAAACSTKRTEIVIGVVTDLPAPGALDQVKLEIYRDNTIAFDIPPWDIPGTASGQFILPASFGVYAEDGQEPRVEVQVHGIKHGNILVTRRAILSLVKEKTLFLRMALVARCSSRAECPDPSDTCIEGRCKTSVVDSRVLKEYQTGLEAVIACQSGTHFINTATHQEILPQGMCAADEFCEEGACYKLPPGFGPGMPDGGITIPGTSGWSQLPIPAAGSPPARRFDNESQAAANAQVFMVWGGRDLNNQPITDTWGFDGGQWTKLANNIGPANPTTLAPADPSGPTVFDPTTNVFVTYREPSGDLMTFDGTNWVAKTRGGDAGTPPPRTLSSLGIDGVNHLVVLYGGLCGTGLCSDMWHFDGTNWQQVTLTSPPPDRKGAQIVFSPGLNKLVLFGGRSTAQFSDTWGWDGSAWNPLASTFPNPVVFSSGGLLVFDSDKSRLEWLNGTREIYSFDGSTWTQSFVDPNGPLIGVFSGAYFAKIHAIMAFGGSDSHNAPLAETWVLNVP